MAERSFTRSGRIARAPAEVWAFMTDLENAPKWIEGVVESKLVGEGPMKAGSVIRETRKLGKRSETYDIEVRAFEAPKEYKAGVKVGKADFAYAYTLAEAEGGTEVTMVATGVCGGLFGGMMVGAAMKYMERADGSQVERLKAAVEATKAPS